MISGSFAKQKMIMVEFLDDKMVDQENEDYLVEGKSFGIMYHLRDR